MSFKLEDQKVYNDKPAQSDIEKSIQETKFEDGGNKKIADSSFKRTLKAIGLAVYILVTGYFLYQTIEDTKNNLGLNQTSITETANRIEDDMKRAIKAGKSREEVRQIPYQHGTGYTSTYTDELIDKLIAEIQEEDRIKGEEREIAILKAEEAIKAIRSAAIDGASQAELEKIAEGYGIQLDPNYRANFDEYRASVSALRDVKQSESLGDVLERLNKAARNGASQAELEEMAKEAGIQLDPSYAANIRAIAGLVELPEVKTANRIKNITMFTKIDGIDRGFELSDDYDVPLYNRKTGEVMILRATNNEEIRDLITGRIVERSEYEGASPVNIRDLVARGELKGYWLRDGNYKIDAGNLVKAVTDLYEKAEAKDEGKEDGRKYSHVEWIRFESIPGIHDAPWENHERIADDDLTPEEIREVEEQIEQIEKHKQQEINPEALREMQQRGYDLRIFINEGGSLKTYKIREELDLPLYNKQTGRVMILRPFSPDNVRDLITGGAVTSEDYYGSSPVNIYDLVDQGILPGMMRAGKSFEFQADDYIATVANYFGRDNQYMPGV